MFILSVSGCLYEVFEKVYSMAYTYMESTSRDNSLFCH